MTSRYQQYDSGTGYDSNNNSYNDETRFSFTAYATFGGEPERVFKSDSQFGQSLGIVFNDVSIIDGALYVDMSGNLKLFSWQTVTGLTPAEHAERGRDLTARDAPEVESRSYGGTDKTYELVAARLEATDDFEASSASRTAELDNDGVQFSDWTDHGGDEVWLSELGYDQIVVWQGASDDHGATVSSERFAEVMTEYGEDAIADPDDAYNWLEGPVGEDIMRNDLEGRRVEVFMTTKESENGYNYNIPVILDADTGQEIEVSNRAVPVAGGSGNEDAPQETAGEPESVTEARAFDEGDLPEPVADFIQSGETLTMDEERAHSLLDDLIAENENPLTEEMVSEYGGRDALVDRVTEA